jgi:hypothetical protein
MDDGADPLVSGEFHKLATETVPDELNQAILSAARKATTKYAFAGWQGAWFRPLAAAAVAALSLTIVLDFNEANNINGSLPATEDAFRNASDLAADQIRNAEAAANRAIQNVPTDTMPSTGASIENVQPSVLSTERGCNEQQRSSMASWWRCVESLQDQGARTLAEQELAMLLRSYPAFIEPKP